MQTMYHPLTFIGGLLIPVAALAFTALVIWLVFRTAARQREVLSRERLAAMERGIPLAPETFLEHRYRRVGNTLKTGMVELAVGAGVVIMLRISNPESGLWGAGIVVILVGLAHVGYWLIRGRQEWEEAREMERELARARAAAMAGDREGGSGDPR